MTMYHEGQKWSEATIEDFQEINKKANLIGLMAKVDKVCDNLLSFTLVRSGAPNVSKWHFRFLDTAKLVSSWSKDPSTKCGAVIVRPDNTIASVGFNGFPRGIADRPELYNNRDEKYQRVIHAEVNAVLSAKEPIKGYTLYSWPPGIGPTCDRCSTVVIQAGVSKIVWVLDESNFASRWREPAMRGISMYKEAGIDLISVSPWAYENASRD